MGNSASCRTGPTDEKLEYMPGRPRTSKSRDPVDDVMGYIFEKPDADVAIANHADITALCEKNGIQWSDDLPGLLRKLGPEIVVNGNDSGMLPRTAVDIPPIANSLMWPLLKLFRTLWKRLGSAVELSLKRKLQNQQQLEAQSQQERKYGRGVVEDRLNHANKACRGEAKA
ncbi:hypothetical protein OBBRIDRAFT_792116 [Obba rivulosa]|uniref:Uncharacterized protein n=1 Tax=Obba rivulosa TaxID=1052685 RepID=A0A8E2B0K5_9APHY|nr:hypothetical protein OBBRIDRAFT_792116 [Obba rivulosa]